jgi:membrane protein DedA with SNARE-associated domain
VRWQRFLWLNFVAAGLWAASFVAGGYFLGHVFNALLGDFARSFRLGMLGVFIAIGFGIWLLHRWQRRRQLRVPAGADVALPPP